MDQAVRELERRIANDPASVVAFVRALARSDEKALTALASDAHAFTEGRGWDVAVCVLAEQTAQQEIASRALASGQTVRLREFSLAGPCLDFARAVRETAKFYVTTRGKRILKNRVHTLPCQRCTDHPKTHYPNGYQG